MLKTRQKTTRHAIRFDSLEQEVFLNLWRTYDRLRALEDELFGQFGLTPQQYNILRLLLSHQPGGLPTLQLASRLVSRAPDITRMLDKLEEHDFVVRERSGTNRRVVVVKIATAGIQLLRRMSKPLQDCHTRQLGHLPATDLKALRDLLLAARKPHETTDGHWVEA
ncbi:MAG: MarR family transcriptional regulator [Planctomycetota bacterium]|nr:MarR family transcriptional regulator [Planctomycetota bacterium]MDA1179385.1 MarR family transcriptional regulator [Planctomycetota bacterium]